jgi:hypothetical protein
MEIIFVFTDDGTLDVVENIEVAQRSYECIDVESDVFIFYDANGNYLEPRFVVPNKTGKFLGLFKWYQSGTFQLVLNTEKNDDPIWVKLAETLKVNKNKWFKSLDDVKQFLQDRGVQVDTTG